MISVSDLRLTAWCSLLFSFLIYSRAPLISWFSLLISVLTHTILYFCSLDIASSRTSKNGSEAKGCTFQWRIENFSSWWLKEEECLQSPVFAVDSLLATRWSIRLYPKGLKSDDSVTVFLKREKDYCGPDIIQVKYQITILDKNGLVLEYKPVWENRFSREHSVFFHLYKRGENVSGSEIKSILPKDTLTVQCKIWKKDEKPSTLDLLSARTMFKVYRRSFVWRIENFSTLKPARRSKFLLIDKLTDGLINFHLVLNEGLGSEKKLDIDIRSSDDFIKFISFKASIIDSEGTKVDCGNHEYFDGDLKKGILFPLFFIKNMFRNKESLYLPNDVLSLDCEYGLSAVESSNECARCGFLSSSMARNRTETGVRKEASVLVNDSESQKECFVSNQKTEKTSILVDDLKSMYSNAILCDVELRTSTQTFPTHRTILSARSSVFRRMFSSDMKEKHSGHVDITDLDNETVHRMLMYMYTESLGDLQVESASKLYVAADKYDIPSLKHECSSFLKCSIHQNTVCDILVLADVHQDSCLKNAVQEFLMEHDKEVFKSLEWKRFMETNIELAADVMYHNISRQ